MTGEPEGIEHLHLIPRLQVATAVAPTLAAGLGLERRVEVPRRLKPPPADHLLARAPRHSYTQAAH